MTTNNPLSSVQRMFEAFAKGDMDRLLETVHPIRAGPMLARIHGYQNVSTSAGKMSGNSSAKSFKT
jgi:hypothetical protein